MAVEVTTTPTFKAGAPRLLFSLPGPLPGNPMQWKNVSKDGDRFIFAMPTQAGPPHVSQVTVRLRRVFATRLERLTQ